MIDEVDLGQLNRAYCGSVEMRKPEDTKVSEAGSRAEPAGEDS